MELLSSIDKPTSGCHLVVMPYPGRGHINPMMNLCRTISSKAPDQLLVSFVVTEEWSGLLGLELETTRPANLRLVSMPNVVPSEKVRGSNPDEFFEAVATRMEVPFERILDRLIGVDPPPTLVLSDSYLPWAIPVANRRNIPVASLFPMSAAVLSLLMSLLEKSENSPAKTSGLNRVFEAVSNLSKAQHLLISTVYELEPEVIDTLRGDIPLPIYTVGPIIKHFELQNRSLSADVAQGSESDYFGWLDMKPDQSVLFVSMGSYLPISSEQMDEFRAGLLEAEVPFLWVVRGEDHELQKTCGDRGLIVPWCDQLRVLCHPAVGGFLSHCGWNSVQEGIYAATPFITFPLGAEQFFNSKLIVEDWKIGYRLKKAETELAPEKKPASVIKRQEISRLVNKLMDRDGDEGKQMMIKIRQLQGFFHRAVSAGGSTATHINAFISNFLPN